MSSKTKFRYSFVKKYAPYKNFKRFKILQFFEDILYPLDKPIQHDSFQSVINSDFHFHEVKEHKLINEGFKKIAKLAEGETVYQLKTTKQSRLLGLKLNNIFYILGFDPKHELY
ncbi:hypothetical Protein psc1_02850 [Candidatus Phytoplasma solani]|uniref:Uncharacterized protein n=1 Tax=Candidatus Phytoplasma solani TaxID=69896 RepID=A0A421NV38_9MOLU|nr:hypothetical protein [Candidatus Phytoplasma solani]RMI87790.1 hypothetical protein PSSA1_v1c5590 [Candidatus Phytoplasma solani]CCP88039.1 conserved hypothetical protein, phage-associated [Candidatus Phytoplasma solani]